MKSICTLIGFLGVSSCCSFCSDWPEYRGPNGDGICAETPNLNWPATGPKVLWKVPVKNGFSSFTIADGKAFTLMNREIEGANREVCVALDASSGKEIWSAPVGVGVYDGGGDSGTAENKGGDGPRSTPTVSDGKVYVFNQLLVLHCLDGQTGKVLWTKDL